MRASRAKKQKKGTAQDSKIVSSNGEAEETGDDMAITNNLGEDTLLNILHRLPTRHLLSVAALVCRHWRRLCQQHLVHDLMPPLYSTPEKPWGSLTEVQLMELAMRHASTLEAIELPGLKQLTSDKVQEMVSGLTHLQHLTIDPTVISNDLQSLVHKLPSQLKTLDLHIDESSSFSFFFPPSITDEVITTLRQRCPNLERLVLHLERLGLYADSWSNVPSFKGLLQTWPSLTLIHLNSSALDWSAVHRIFESCPSLEDLSLCSSRLLLIPIIIADNLAAGKGAEVAGNHWKGVLGVSMPRSLVSIRLYTSSHHSVPWDSLPADYLMRSKGHQFQRLHAQTLFNSSWHNIALCCLNLKSLDLSHADHGNYRLTEVEETVLCMLVRQLEKLEELALPTATDRILVGLGRHCARLSQFFFQGHGVRRRGLSKQLHVTDRGVIALAEGCPALRVLSLEGCSKVTISSVRVLAFHCRNVEVLKLAGCSGLTDEAVTLLLRRFGRSLLLLDLLGCPKLTSGVVHAVLQSIQVHGTGLRMLAIPNSIMSASRSVVAQIKKLLPSLSVRGNNRGSHWDGFYHCAPWSYYDYKRHPDWGSFL